MLYASIYLIFIVIVIHLLCYNDAPIFCVAQQTTSQEGSYPVILYKKINYIKVNPKKFEFYKPFFGRCFTTLNFENGRQKILWVHLRA